MSEPDHRHHWGQAQRRDYCHYVAIERTCKDCGETVVDAELGRDFDQDPLEVTFAREDCARCRELLKGNEPASWTTKGEPNAQPSG